MHQKMTVNIHNVLTLVINSFYTYFYIKINNKTVLIFYHILLQFLAHISKAHAQLIDKDYMPHSKHMLVDSTLI